MYLIEFHDVSCQARQMQTQAGETKWGLCGICVSGRFRYLERVKVWGLEVQASQLLIDYQIFELIRSGREQSVRYGSARPVCPTAATKCRFRDLRQCAFAEFASTKLTVWEVRQWYYREGGFR